MTNARLDTFFGGTDGVPNSDDAAVAVKPAESAYKMARRDVLSALEALRLDAERVYQLGAFERRFWLKKLTNAQELLEKLGDAHV